MFFFSHLKNGATVSHLGSCIEASPLAARTDPGGLRTCCGTKHSISASDITAVSSAVSACAINSVAERADCLCRKYLTPDPQALREIDFFSFHGSGELDPCQCINHDIWVFVHAHLMVVCLSPCTVFWASVMYYLVPCGKFIISDLGLKQTDRNRQGYNKRH